MTSLTAPRPATADRARLYRLVAVVTALGLASMGGVPLLASSAAVPSVWALVLTTAVVLFGDVALIHFRIGHNQCSWTFAEAAIVLGLVLVPPAWLVLVAPVGVAAAHLLARRQLLKVAYNAMTAASGAFVAGTVLSAVTGSAGAADPERTSTWVGLALATMAFTVWNGIAISAAVAVAQGVPVLVVFGQAGLLRLFSWAGNTAAALVLVALVGRHPVALGLVPVCFGLLYGGYQGYLRATQERDTWRVLQATSHDLNRLERSDIADVVLSRGASLFRAEFVELMVVNDEPATHAAVYRQSAGADAQRFESDLGDVAAEFWPRAESEREPFTVHAHQAPAAQRRELESLGLVSCLVAPLISQGRCLGMLRIGFCGPVTLTVRELAALSTFVDQVSGSVLNSWLFETVTEERAKLRQVLDSASDGILSVDAAGRVTSWNPAMVRITGIPATQALGSGFTLGPRARIVDDAAPDREADAEWLREAVADREQAEATIRIGSEQGGRWLHASISAGHTGGGLESAVLVIRDVTALHEAEEAKQDFVATVSHELRTPITSLKGWLLTLLRPEYEPDERERREVYTTLMHQTGRLQRLVEDLLSISVLEHGEFSVAAVPVDLDEVVAKTLADLAVRSPDRPVSHDRSGLGASALGDPGRIEQVITNLISNADKYSPAGLPIAVRVAKHVDGVEVRVVDHGRGIPEEQREAVFDRFRRLGHHMTREENGAGLGLHIARKLVQAMGGRIWVEGTVGTGATVRFTLPPAELVLDSPPLPSTSGGVDGEGPFAGDAGPELFRRAPHA